MRMSQPDLLKDGKNTIIVNILWPTETFPSSPSPLLPFVYVGNFLYLRKKVNKEYCDKLYNDMVRNTVFDEQRYGVRIPMGKYSTGRGNGLGSYAVDYHYCSTKQSFINKSVGRVSLLKLMFKEIYGCTEDECSYIIKKYHSYVLNELVEINAIKRILCT
jgi:hypothetical protein